MAHLFFRATNLRSDGVCRAHILGSNRPEQFDQSSRRRHLDPVYVAGGRIAKRGQVTLSGHAVTSPIADYRSLSQGMRRRCSQWFITHELGSGRISLNLELSDPTATTRTIGRKKAQNPQKVFCASWAFSRPFLFFLATADGSDHVARHGRKRRPARKVCTRMRSRADPIPSFPPSPPIPSAAFPL